MPSVRFPDAEAMVCSFLRTRLDDVPVATKTPNPRPARYIRAWRTGGVADNRAVESVHITVTCAAGDTITASADSQACRFWLLNESAAMPLVRRVREMNGPYYDPDPDTGADRYSQTFILTVRGAR